MNKSNTILLPIKPDYCNKIFTGQKKYEYRKRLAQQNIQNIIVYATSPVKKVIGEVEVISTITKDKEMLWQLTKSFSGISELEYNNYFLSTTIASCYQLGEFKLYTSPKELSEIGITYVPQSFVYIKNPPESIS